MGRHIKKSEKERPYTKQDKQTDKYRQKKQIYKQSDTWIGKIKRDIWRD